MYDRSFFRKLLALLCIVALCAVYQTQIAIDPAPPSAAAPDDVPPAPPDDAPAALPAESADPVRADYADGVYTGRGEGYGGAITVEVTVEGGQLTAIKVLDGRSEDGSYLRSAKQLIPKVLAAQHTELDAISGATYSSWGILNAIDDALTGTTAR